MKSIKNLLIVGFNARPIALSARRAGFNVKVVDFWGDVDLLSVIPDAFIVSKERQEQTEKVPIADLLAESVLEVLGESEIKTDALIIGSGLDDRADLWEKLNKQVPVLGCEPNSISKIRNRKLLEDACEDLKINYPRTYSVSEWTELSKLAERLKYPVVVRLPFGAGGQFIGLARNISQLKQVYNSLKKKNPEPFFYLQEFIQGRDVSTTMLSNKREYRVLSCNEQLLSVGSDDIFPFKYSGNLIPLKTTSSAVDGLVEVSKSISARFGLLGIFGIDFVLKDDEPWLMEINPRFPGTFELLEKVIRINLMKHHVAACQGKDLPTVPEITNIGMKKIIFARNDVQVGDLSGIKGIFDVPSPNTFVREGEPICSIQVIGKNRHELNKKVEKITRTVISYCNALISRLD
ncbi:MAG: ATP-grasp domain-containing protein [Candidatus Helarchaeota archaeon]